MIDRASDRLPAAGGNVAIIGLHEAFIRNRTVDKRASIGVSGDYPMSSPRTRILLGLPGYGPRAVAFPASGYGAHREGLVVEFQDEHGAAWVGNFQPGLN